MSLNRRIALKDSERPADSDDNNSGCLTPATVGIAFLVFVPVSYWLAGLVNWI